MNRNIYIIPIFALLLVGCSGTKPELGIKDLKLMQCLSSPNCVSTQAKDTDHFIDPIVIQSTQLKTKESILKLLSQFKQSKIIETEDNYIRAEFSSKLFGFVDDVEFYFPDTKSEEIIIHMRSAARLGYSDLGVNRKRVEEIKRKFKAIYAIP